MIKLIMADDHPLIRAGMKYLLDAEPDMELSAEVNNGTELVQLLRESAFDVVLMDMMMPGRSGLELLKQLRHEFPQIPVIVLSTHKEEMFAVRSIRSGASAYLCKDDAATNLVFAIRQVAEGGLFITPELGRLMAGAIQSNNPGGRQLSSLSDREHQILLLLAADQSICDVADSLCLSGKTVSTYKARIKLKLGLETNADIIRYGIENKLADEKP
ncbi:MAG: response regulator transcription factor [Marinobacter sp.]